MSFLQTLRKLVLGETWTLPAAVALAVAIAAAVRIAVGATAGWQDGGGPALIALLAIAFATAVLRGTRR